MGGGDLNMKKSWHPVLLVNQERVWKAEKTIHEEKKKLAQLRKEQEEERQLAELQRLQEVATGKKRVEKLDWMYAAPTNEGSALGGARIGERDMEDYLLGKKRVDEVLAAGDKNVGNTHKDFIAVQNANTARDTAAKIREDPMFLIKKQELAAIEAMKNDPAIRRKLKEMQKAKEAKAGKEGESKEERRARKRAEKEDKKRDKHSRHSHSHSYRDSRSPRSDYSDDRDRDRDHHRSHRDDRRDNRSRYEERSRHSRSDRDSHRDRDRSRSSSPKYDRHRRDDSPRRHRDSDGDARASGSGSGSGSRDRVDDRIPPPRHYPSQEPHGHSTYSSSYPPRDIRPHASRPSAMDLADRPTSSSTTSRPHSNGYNHHSVGPAGEDRKPAVPSSSSVSNNLDDQRAARLAAMQSSASALDTSRNASLAARAEKERIEEERDKKMRAKYKKEEVHGGFYKQQTGMGLSESLSRRGGQGLQRDI